MRQLLGIFTIFSILFCSAVAQAQTDEAPTEVSNYGQVFMVETSRPKPERFDVGLLAGADIGNPYISSGIGEVFARARVLRLLQVGVKYSLYTSKRSGLAQSVEDELNLYGIISRFPVPESSLFGELVLTLFRGKLNFWGYKQIDIDMLLEVAGGNLKIEQEESEFGFGWGFGMRLGFNRRFAGHIMLNQDFVGADTSTTFTRLTGGASISF